MGPEHHVSTLERRGAHRAPSTIAFAAAVLFCCTAAAAGAGAQAAPQTRAPLPAGYAGSAECHDCHSDHTHSYDASPHANRAAMLAAAKRAGLPAASGCESCHGPGKAHADAMEAAGGNDAAAEAALQKYPMEAFRTAAGAAANSRVCLSCHQTGTEQMSFAHSVHLENNVACENCHDVHGPAAAVTELRLPQPQLCYQCHQQQQAEFRMPFHHPVPEGLVQCTDCHNPHGSLIPTQLRAAAARDQVCYTCHEDKQGPFIFAHEPVATEGCTDCHAPHGSPNPHLMKVANVNQMCLSCHTASSFSGAPGTPSFHNQATQFQACTLCHTQIHGSNLDPAFTR